MGLDKKCDNVGYLMGVSKIDFNVLGPLFHPNALV